MTATAPASAGPSYRHRYLPGIDGLRAVSVAAVLAYHLDFDWARGGYLGVEVFFVVSGFLITGLMLSEHERTGSIRRIAFWVRRARRLLPAVVVLIGLVCLWAAFAYETGELLAIRGDAVAGLFYVQNWHAVVTEQPYFVQFGRPSPLRHLWSLAIEEQFYLLWPLLLPLLLRLLGRRGAAVATIGLALGSIALMGHLGDITAPDRAYYGTDTRIGGILVGAALAFVWRPDTAPRELSERARSLLVSIGTIAMVLLGWQFVHRSEFDPWTFPRGFAYVDLLTVVLIVLTTHPATGLDLLVGAGPLQAIGRRSYSIYLWHWPVIVSTRPDVDWPLDGPLLLAVRLALIAGLSELSYRVVEQPLRSGEMPAWLTGRGSPNMRRRRPLAVGGVGAAVLAGILVTAAETPRTVVATSAVQIVGAAESDGASVPVTIDITDVAALPNVPSSALQAAPPSGPPGTPAEPPPSVPPPSDAAPPATAPVTPVEPAPAVPAPTSTEPGSPRSEPSAELPPEPPPKEVTVIGESVTLGAARAMQDHWEDRVQIDAVESRTFEEGIELIEWLGAHGRLTPTVIVHVGTNGAAPRDGFQRIVDAVGPDRRLILVSVRVPRRWEEQVNGEIWTTVQRHDHVLLADWYRLTHDEPGVLQRDGVHLTDHGKLRYRDLMVGFQQ